MKKLLITLLAIPVLSFSQEKEVLKYYKTRDSLVGVKNQDGKIIIPAQFSIFSYLKDGEVVKGETVYFDGNKKDEKPIKNEWGYVYSRKGDFLYRPFFYDNGADYFSEGLRRFVKNGKIGFVDRNGQVVIKAEHDFASPFNYGYTAFCDGCDWEDTEDEHKAIVGGTWGVMNFRGETVKPISKTEQAIEINSKYFPNPFNYNEKERTMLQFFEKQNKRLSELYYVNHFTKLSDKEKMLSFEIVEKPKQNFPFYQINTYDYRKVEAGLSYRFKFLVSEDGKSVYAMDEDEKIPFEKWLKTQIKKAKDFEKKYPDHPNKLSK